MKKIISLVVTAALLFTSATVSFAKQDNAGKHNGRENAQSQNQSQKAKKNVFKINGSPVIKYGRYKIPISPITKGMGATVAFDEVKAVLTVTKGTITIVIDFKAETVTVNGTLVTDSGIFTARTDKRVKVLVKYIANVLGVRANGDDDEIEIQVPELNPPTDITVTPVGPTLNKNILNASTLYLTAAANVIAGQAAGGKAELYVGSKLVATDDAISATDTSVTFTTSDGTPTNEELQAAVPKGGAVTVKLYNADNKSVTGEADLKLHVDYESPTITNVTSAVYNPSTGRLYLNVAGAGAAGDKVDVTKILFIDSALKKTYQLTNTAGSGSSGVVERENLLVIKIGSADMLGLKDFGTTLSLTISAGSLLRDAAGNTSASLDEISNIPVNVISK